MELAKVKPVTFSDLVELTKPRLVLSVVITGLAGFFLARQEIRLSDLKDVFLLSVGIFFAGAGAHAFNQYLEVIPDSKMKRTANRPLPSGRMLSGDAVFVGLISSLIGYLILFFSFNPLSGFVAISTIIFYVFFYTPLKKYSVWNTWVGAVPGAMPPLIGWAAAKNTLSLDVFWIFALILVWQIPHFIALAWKYKEEYIAGGLKMLPGNDASGKLCASVIVSHILLLLAVTYYIQIKFTALDFLYNYSAIALGVLFLWTGVRFFFRTNAKNAFKVFISSVLYLPILMIALIIDLTLI